MPSAPSKYDPFFSHSMEYVPIAQAFLQQYLPVDLLPLVQLDTLLRVDRTHTDPELRKRHRDVTYQAQLGETDKLYTCLEHQSQPDVMMPMRCLYYGADSAMPYFQQHKRMPVVITIVFYQGEQSPYPYSPHLVDYYTHPEWGQPSLSSSFLVIDVNTYSDETLLTHGVCAPMEILLKHGRKGKFELPVEAYRSVFTACVATVGNEYIFTMLRYATSLSNQAVGKKVYQFVEEVLLDKKEIIMTYGQVLENRGEVRGMQKGMQTKSLEIAKNMFSELHLDMESVRKVTGLSQEDLKRIYSQAEKKG